MEKAILVFGLCDETFAINFSAKVPDGVDRGWFIDMAARKLAASAARGIAADSAYNKPSACVIRNGRYRLPKELCVPNGIPCGLVPKVS